MRVDKSKWDISYFKDIAVILNGYAFKSDKYCSDGIRIIRITNVQDGFIEDNDPKFYPYSTENGLQKYMLRENDLLISLTGNVGRVGILNDSFLPAALNQRVGCIRPKNKINTKFIYYQLRKNSFKEDCINSSKGVAQLNMSTEWLKDYKLFVPPLVEQQEIAAELDAVQVMIDGYKAQIADLDALAQSIFLDMFGDPTINSKGWEILKIGEICEVTSSKRIYQSEQTKSGIPFYKISDFPNLIKYGYNNTEIFISQAKYEELKSQKLVPNENDLLITSRGTLGLCYIVKDGNHFYFQDGMITWLRNLKPTVLSAFLGFMFQSSLFKNQIEKAQNGSTIAYLSISMIRKFDMIVPPIKLQQHFATQVEAIEKQKELLRQQLADAETLMAERMQYYFS